MPRPSLHHERELLASGVLAVDADGAVWRLRRNRRPCAPYRAETALASGYLTVPVVIDGEQRWALAHRLVYEARVGRIPDGYLVRQKNGVRHDNRPSNLVAVPRTATPARRREAPAEEPRTTVL